MQIIYKFKMNNDTIVCTVTSQIDNTPCLLLSIDTHQIEEYPEDEPPLLISVVWNVGPFKIVWGGFDDEFQNFFDFLSKIKQNQKCQLGGGGNSYWTLCHEMDSDETSLEFDISGSGGDSSLSLSIPNKNIIDAFEKICSEIKTFQLKYPNQTRF
jgi:hypothetical protein